MRITTTGKLGIKWKVIAGVVVVGSVAALVGWRAYANHQVRSVSNFSECQKAQGSVFLESYPEICMTKDKKQFPNTSQHLVPPSANMTLIIKEWGVRLNIDEPDAYYRLNSDGTVYLSTASLDAAVAQVMGCKAGLHGITINRNLSEAQLAEIMCMPNTSQDVMQKVTAVQAHLREALKSPEKFPSECLNEPELSASCAKASGVY